MPTHRAASASTGVPCAATAAMSERAVIDSVMPICSGMLPCFLAARSHGSITSAAHRFGSATSQPVVVLEKSPMLLTIVGSHMPSPYAPNTTPKNSTIRVHRRPLLNTSRRRRRPCFCSVAAVSTARVSVIQRCSVLSSQRASCGRSGSQKKTTKARSTAGMPCSRKTSCQPSSPHIPWSSSIHPDSGAATAFAIGFDSTNTTSTWVRYCRGNQSVR